MSVVTGGDATNQRVAQVAVRHYIDVLTIGNERDYTFNFNACPGYSNTPDSRFLSTQWITDQGNQFPPVREGNHRGATEPVRISESWNKPRRVFLSPAVQTALIEWSQGETPAALPKAPIGP